MINNEELVNSNSNSNLTPTSTSSKQTNRDYVEKEKKSATYQSLSAQTSIPGNTASTSFNWNNTNDQGSSMYHLALQQQQQQQQHYSHMLNLYHRNLFERLVLPAAAAAASATAFAIQSTGMNYPRKLSSDSRTSKRQPPKQQQFTIKTNAEKFQTGSLLIGGGQGELNNNDQVSGGKKRRRKRRRGRRRKKRSDKVIAKQLLDGIKEQTVI